MNSVTLQLSLSEFYTHIFWHFLNLNFSVLTCYSFQGWIAFNDLVCPLLMHLLLKVFWNISAYVYELRFCWICIIGLTKRVSQEMLKNGFRLCSYVPTKIVANMRSTRKMCPIKLLNCDMKAFNRKNHKGTLLPWKSIVSNWLLRWPSSSIDQTVTNAHCTSKMHFKFGWMICKSFTCFKGSTYLFSRQLSVSIQKNCTIFGFQKFFKMLVWRV